jgi:hypothetical protein
MITLSFSLLSSLIGAKGNETHSWRFIILKLVMRVQGLFSRYVIGINGRSEKCGTMHGRSGVGRASLINFEA